jgi:glycosyltransferase involved in cell wall biosynthesis
MSRPDPKVTIGVPVFNADRFLSETIDSLLGQTFGDFEIVLSDNGSTDRTEEICRDFTARDTRVKYFRNVENMGMVGNFNRLVDLASGQYFRWAAADDLNDPEFLGSCVEVLDRDDGVVLVAPRTKFIDAEGRELPFDSVRGVFVTGHGETIHPMNPHPDFGSPLAQKRFRSILLHLTSNLLASHVYGLTRTAALKRTLLFESYLGGEKVMLSRLALQGRFHDVTEPYFWRRFHPDHFGRQNPRTTAKLMAGDKTKRVIIPEGQQILGYERAVRSAGLPRRQLVLCYTAIVEKLGRVAGQRILRRRVWNDRV